MTLARTALRLCAVEALIGATIADKRVWDSRVTELNPDEFGSDALPTVLLLSDKDDGEQMSQNNGGPPFWRSVDLQLEIAMVKRVKLEGTEIYEAEIPDTDPRLEASLDLFEFQVLRRLQYGQDPLCLMFRKLARITKYDSHRQILDDATPKQAMRLLTLTCVTQDDRVNLVNTAIEQPTGYDLLPWPLSEVAALLPEGSASKQIVDGIVVAIGKVTVPPFTGMDADVVKVGDEEGTADPEAESNVVVISADPEQP